jgi:mRNA interferase RelE/StbE
VPDYAVVFKTSARRELQRLQPAEVARIFERICSLSAEPRPSGCRKLANMADLWRIRVGDYRVVYSIDDGAQRIRILAVRHRSDAYR